ncbi:MAG: hypothetical protein PHF93_10150, partial [Acidobacteriota bacterium]|nr:hypothetical protein [Acidobacteriota bacterium]HNQ81134.1 hypothetical protein [Candidatus Aminicenantes bacterium]MDW3227325.1 hypothetical protein [Acidobacteriota bacterium]HNT32873.1 hypothetical protein [Candidatus Aminicenantes bacterium]HOY99391.1 hypothetical protein [Candidatus Aminicenantes bacterium]
MRLERESRFFAHPDHRFLRKPARFSRLHAAPLLVFAVPPNSMADSSQNGTDHGEDHFPGRPDQAAR